MPEKARCLLILKEKYNAYLLYRLIEVGHDSHGAGTGMLIDASYRYCLAERCHK